jgi:UDP-N-acetylglucosamine 4,6-dehydratase
MDDCYYNGKTILVTGGVGSIGAEIVKQLVDQKPKIVRIFDNNETELFHAGEKYGIDKVRLFVGDVRDKERLLLAMEDVDVVFHAAALKHVSLCEYNPFDAVKTNVTGTQNVIRSAMEKGVAKVIFISTDKAVNPTGVMGATKLLAERLMTAASYYTGEGASRFASVRFGNVLDSRGSVVPIFRKQIAAGGPVTVTDSRMTRFFMSIPEAARLVLTAGQMSTGGEVFVLKMPAIKIVDLALAMVGSAAIECKVIGRKGGEKLSEELITEEESTRAYENNEMFVILPQGHPLIGYPETPFGRMIEINGKVLKKIYVTKYSSDSVELLTIPQIVNILDKLES